MATYVNVWRDACQGDLSSLCEHSVIRARGLFLVGQAFQPAFIGTSGQAGCKACLNIMGHRICRVGALREAP